jgi:membrane-anchored glycerophosphoryl diester phosphodiesterase (GDPDase)
MKSPLFAFLIYVLVIAPLLGWLFTIIMRTKGA